jgi:hypothetical protein
MELTTREINHMFSTEDWWFHSFLSEKDRLRIEREKGIEWNDMSDVLKKMIMEKENNMLSRKLEQSRKLNLEVNYYEIPYKNQGFIGKKKVNSKG